MTLAGILDRALDSFGDSLPRLVGALALLVVGLIVAWAISRVVGRVLGKVGIDELGRRWQLDDVLARVGLGRSISQMVARIVRVVISIVVVFAAVSQVGLESLDQTMNEAILYIPKLLVALVIVVAGVVVGRFLGERVDRLATQMALSGPLGKVTQALVVVLFGLLALAQIGIPTQILTVIVGALVVSAALTATLAFGLGSRDVARQVSAGRYVAGSFVVGQRISVGEVSGRIEALESSAALLRTEDGLVLRVPNTALLESVVTLHDAPAPDGAEPPEAAADAEGTAG